MTALPPTTSGQPAASTPGRKRSESARLSILAAAYELLVSTGFQQMSIEGVASRANVGKATIYRWWRNKGVLAAEAFMHAVAPAIAFQESPSARADIARQMKGLSLVYRGRTGEILAEMIAHSQGDPGMREALFAGYLQPRRAAAKAVLQRGMDQGEFLPNLDLEMLVDALYGPLIYRMLIRQHPITDQFIEQTWSAVFDGIVRREV